MDKPVNQHNSEEFIKSKSDEYYKALRQKTFRQISYLFCGLLLLQWVAKIVLTIIISPQAWNGIYHGIHPHIWAAVFLGGIITVFPAFLAFKYPEYKITRHVIGTAQMLTSGLLIHLSGGRIETHFHIFGSLAFLAFYRDSRVIVTASLVTALDHLIRGYFFPLSVYGVEYASIWRTIEHAGWVIFESGFLIWSCNTGDRETREVALNRAELEEKNMQIQESAQQLLFAEVQLRQGQKLESIGQLAAGIAHEINTPVQFVGDNTRFLQTEFDNMQKLVDGCVEMVDKLSNSKGVQLQEIQNIIKKTDLPYLKEEIPKAISQSLEGIDRITKIVRAMKEFSHPGKVEKQSIDLNKAIESTLIVSTNEWKYVAEVKTDFDKSLPLVPCIAGELNQVILNLIVNSAHALNDNKKDMGKKGEIVVSTKKSGDAAEIRIHDNGPGIPEEITHKIFDPFFTTKEVGKGTGQGLAIARSIIVNKHGGTIDFESKPGDGTTFVVRLPLQ